MEKRQAQLEVESKLWDNAFPKTGPMPIDAIGPPEVLMCLSRNFIAQMDALKKYCAKAQQTVRVERVTVNEGGQAIVGSVAHGMRSRDMVELRRLSSHLNRAAREYE